MSMPQHRIGGPGDLGDDNNDAQKVTGVTPQSANLRQP